MKRDKKWATVTMALIAMGVLAGCGTSGGQGTPPATNEANNAATNATNTTQSAGNTTSLANATNITGSASSNTGGSMVSVSIPLTNGQSEPSINFEVPSGWVKQKVGQGDSNGYAWVNPNDNNQQIQLIFSASIGAIQNYQNQQWDVTGIFGHGTKGITWTNVASDKLTANFTDTTGTNYFAENEKTPYTGYGKAFIVQKPNPFSVYVEVWGPESLANLVLPTVQLQQQQGAQQTVYVFSQSMLKVMYVVEYFRSVGPIIPPANIQSEVDKWAPKVSMNMLPYAPASEQALDKQLIENIDAAVQIPSKMTLLNHLPGYTLHKDQLPSGERIYWYPSNNKFPTWADPVRK